MPRDASGLCVILPEWCDVSPMARHLSLTHPRCPAPLCDRRRHVATPHVGDLPEPLPIARHVRLRQQGPGAAGQGGEEAEGDELVWQQVGGGVRDAGEGCQPLQAGQALCVHLRGRECGDPGVQQPRLQGRGTEAPSRPAVWALSRGSEERTTQPWAVTPPFPTPPGCRLRCGRLHASLGAGRSHWDA